MNERMKEDPLSQEELNKLDGLTRAIRFMKRRADSVDNTSSYAGLKDFFQWWVIRMQEFQLNDLQRGLTAGTLRCACCGKKIGLYTEEEINKIADGADPNTLRDEDFRRAIPEDLKEKHNEKN